MLGMSLARPGVTPSRFRCSPCDPGASAFAEQIETTLAFDRQQGLTFRGDRNGIGGGRAGVEHAAHAAPGQEDYGHDTKSNGILRMLRKCNRPRRSSFCANKLQLETTSE